MKIIGGVMLLFIIGYCGLEWSRTYDRRVVSIRTFMDALQMIDAEMHYSKAKLTQIFSKLANVTKGPVNRYFQYMATELLQHNRIFTELWKETMINMQKELALYDEDIHILLQLGEHLGAHPYEQQQKHIQLCSLQLHTQLEEARERRNKYSHTIKIASLLVGLLLFILII